MNVLVTGATAPLGQAIVDRLLATPDVGLVLAVGRGGPTTSCSPRLVRCAVDLIDVSAVRELVRVTARDHAIDTVVHAAQHRAPDDRGRRVHAQNVDAARMLYFDLDVGTPLGSDGLAQSSSRSGIRARARL